MAIDFSKVLNPEQCAAATAPDGPMLVLAAAGTGKTRTLVHRVAYLVEKGVPPERILLLTFTNRAANEMLERAQRVVSGVTGIWVSVGTVPAGFTDKMSVVPVRRQDGGFPSRRRLGGTPRPTTQSRQPQPFPQRARCPLSQ